MAKKQKKNSISIKRYKNKRELNIGIFIFALVFIYLVVAVIMYATNKRISVYEVRAGSIVRDTSYTGLILREETIVNADSSGYINYFQSGQNKVKSGANICAVSTQKLEYPTTEVSDDGDGLSPEEQGAIVLKTQNFNENFNPQKFSSVYSLKNEVSSILQDASNQTRTEQLDALIAQSGDNIQVYSAARDGIIVLTFDGEEGLTKENFTEEDFDRSNYQSTMMEDNMEIQAGNPAYKLVTSENWSVVIPLEDDMAKELADTQNIKTKLDQNSDTMWADFSILKKDGKFYGCLEFNNSMIRYANERYVRVELILEDQSGLKIPKSSVVEKECYIIPQDYLTTGANSSNTGVMVQNGTSAQFQEVNLYNVTQEGNAYIASEEFTDGTILIKPESTETMSLTQKENLTGVFNINKGYAIFNSVEILCESDEYYIIREGSTYGPSNYDHIVQDGSTVQENEVVFQ